MEVYRVGELTSLDRRRSRGPSRPCLALTLKPEYHILAQDGKANMRDTVWCLMHSTSKEVAPILAACSGHLLSDLFKEHDNDDVCPHCAMPHVSQHKEGTTTWDRMWHNLIECSSNEIQQTRLAEFEADMLKISDQSLEYDAKLKQLLISLHTNTSCAATRSHMTKLLIDPAGHMDPPKHIHRHLVAAVGGFLGHQAERIPAEEAQASLDTTPKTTKN